MTYHALKNVSDHEVMKMLNYKKFSNFFKLMNSLSLIDGFPNDWLLTSIDYSSVAPFPPRVKLDGPNHAHSRAVDLVPLTPDKLIRLPIPLNRNLLLMRLFKTHAESMFRLSNLPIIAFESDHLHVDINHDGGVAYFTALRPRLDRVIASLAQRNKALSRALDSRELIYL